MRIADNPNHPSYGPVRRFWVVLAQLDMLESAEAWRDPMFGVKWDEWLVIVLPGVPESETQRALLRLLLRENDR